MTAIIHMSQVLPASMIRSVGETAASSTQMCLPLDASDHVYLYDQLLAAASSMVPPVYLPRHACTLFTLRCKGDHHAMTVRSTSDLDVFLHYLKRLRVPSEPMGSNTTDWNVEATSFPFISPEFTGSVFAYNPVPVAAPVPAPVPAVSRWSTPLVLERCGPLFRTPSPKFNAASDDEDSCDNRAVSPAHTTDRGSDNSSSDESYGCAYTQLCLHDGRCYNPNCRFFHTMDTRSKKRSPGARNNRMTRSRVH